MKDKKKLQKKKERERKVKTKLACRREAIIAKREEEKRQDEDFGYAVSEQMKPFKYSDLETQQRRKAKEINEKLKNNMKILKALEEKIIKEERDRGVDKSDEEIKQEFHAALQAASPMKPTKPEELCVAGEQPKFRGKFQEASPITKNRPCPSDAIEIEIDPVEMERSIRKEATAAKDRYKKAYETRLYEATAAKDRYKARLYEDK